MKISKGNSKLGKIANFNITPLRTCSPEACNTCGKNGCYALKAYRQYPAVRTAWDENTELAINDIPTLYQDLRKYFTTFKGKIFRIHSAGDFVSIDYLKMWADIAFEFKNINFMAYTKQFKILQYFIDIYGRNYMTRNFKIILSSWTGLDIPSELSYKFSIAWLCEDGQNAPVMVYNLKKAGRSVRICGGDCTVCKYCYEPTGLDVIFIKH